MCFKKSYSLKEVLLNIAKYPKISKLTSARKKSTGLLGHLVLPVVSCFKQKCNCAIVAGVYYALFVITRDNLLTWKLSGPVLYKCKPCPV